MADSKLSALTATTTLIDSDEFYVNDGGTSKKITKANLDDNINIALSQVNDVTATSAEVNVLDGIPATLTATELGYVDGVTSAIQTQLDGKQATITGAATTIDDADLTASRALVSDGSGKVAVSSVTSTELGYVSGVTSALQTQLDAKLTATAAIGDTGQNFASQARTSGTSYQNTSGAPIQVSAYAAATTSGSASLKIEWSADNSTWVTVAQEGITDGVSHTQSVTAIIPNNDYYKVTGSNIGTLNVVELS